MNLELYCVELSIVIISVLIEIFDKTKYVSPGLLLLNLQSLKSTFYYTQDDNGCSNINQAWMIERLIPPRISIVCILELLVFP